MHDASALNQNRSIARSPNGGARFHDADPSPQKDVVEPVRFMVYTIRHPSVNGPEPDFAIFFTIFFQQPAGR